MTAQVVTYRVVDARALDLRGFKDGEVRDVQFTVEVGTDAEVMATAWEVLGRVERVT